MSKNDNKEKAAEEYAFPCLYMEGTARAHAQGRYEGFLAGISWQKKQNEEDTKALERENENLKYELLEEARINGMGSEREARLMARIKEAERKIDVITSKLNKKGNWT